MRSGCIAAFAILAIAIVDDKPAHAYEFWLRADTIGQSYQLRNYRLIGPDLFLGRRRYTQTLALRIWDIGDLSADRRRAHLPDRGLRISFHGYLRIDHDFGTFTSGRINFSQSLRRDALDVTPELAESTAALDLMYGYVELAGIADDRVTLRIGRTIADDGWGTTAIDGGSVRVELPPPLAVTAMAGLRVRAASPLGLAAYELDGTSGAACREYVEALTPGTGTWKLIDRDRVITNTKLASDFEYCPQREVLQPTIAATIATSRVRHVGAELGYRRTWSSTVGLIGTVDRLQFDDLGLYPNEFGQAPSSGVNEEYLHARAYGDVTRRGVTIAPYADVRYSLVHAAIDRADAGVRLTRGAHTLEPTVGYYLPTFDADSIFNVFSIEPTGDARLDYRYDGAVRANAGAWLRRYASGPDYSGGFDAGLERRLRRDLRARVDALWDDGYGGRRAGGSAESQWRPTPKLWLRGRAAALAVDDDRRRYVTSSTVASATWRIGQLVAVHAIAEADYDAVHDLQTRAIMIVDLAFEPEP